MAIVSNGNAPYAAVKNVLDVVEVHRDRGARPITGELLLRLGVPEGNVGRTIQALRLLDLIDDAGEPTSALTELRRASAEEYQARFEQVIRAAYDDVFQVVDPASAVPTALDDAFRLYQPGSQRARMVTLFLGLCEEAGIITKGPRKRGRAEKTRVAPTSQVRATAPPPQVRQQPPAARREYTPPNGMPDVDDTIIAVLRKLPPQRKWTHAERKRWLRAFEANLDLAVETTDAEATGGAPDAA